jgi:hypothetical protein
MSLLVTVLAGCATPGERIDRAARGAEFQRTVVHGVRYDHVVYRNDRPARDEVLHVYIEGDGRPYLDRFTPSPDPTPRRALMLGLMAADPGPAIYVGRPCYFGLATDAPCTPLDWTLHRFSADVVDSMAAVIAAAGAGATSVQLFAHSGGATLAVLLARRLPYVTAIVTLAGNLDPAAWTLRHGYAPLDGSLDPLSGGVLPAATQQWHLAGSRDENIPPALIEAAVRKLGGGDVRIVADADHTCCWQRVWPGLLTEVADTTARQGRQR